MTIETNGADTQPKAYRNIRGTYMRLPNPFKALFEWLEHLPDPVYGGRLTIMAGGKSALHARERDIEGNLIPHEP